MFLFSLLILLFFFYFLASIICIFENKLRIIGIFLVLLLLVLPFFQVPVKPNDEIPIRGVVYWQGFTNFNEIKSLGANWVCIMYWVEVDWDTGEILEKTPIPSFIKFTQLEDAEKAIKVAKKNGLKVLLQVYPEYFMRDKPMTDTHRFELKHGPVKDQEGFLENATKLVMKIAKFAEENNVDMFSPWCEMNVFVDWNHTRKWYAEIPYRIRKVYHGLLLTPKGEITWNKYGIGPEGDLSFWNFSGYDYIGADVFDNDFSLNSTHKGTCKDFECYRLYIRTLIGYLEELKEKYNAKGIILGSEVGIPEGFFANELKKGVKPKEFIERAWEVLFNESKGRVDGYFFFPWKGIQGTGVGNIYFSDMAYFLKKYYGK